MAKSLAKSGALVGIGHSAEQQRGRRASVARDLQNTKFQFAEVKMCLSAHRAPIARPIGCPQMTWGRTLENALKSKGISKDFDEWIAIAKDRSKWRQLTHSIPKPPDA